MNYLKLVVLFFICATTSVATPLTPAQKSQFTKGNKTGLPYDKFSESTTYGPCLCVVKATICKETARDQHLITSVTCNTNNKYDGVIAFLEDKPTSMNAVEHNDILKCKFFAYTKDALALKKIKSTFAAGAIYADVYMLIEKPKTGSPEWKMYFRHVWSNVLYRDGKVECPAYNLKYIVPAEVYEKTFPSSK